MKAKVNDPNSEEGMRRTFDILLATAGLVVLSPLLVAVALLIRVSSRGPILFRQQRVGRDGEPFTILKFRTMRTDAESVGGQLTVGTDPRVTKLGAVLRAWKLDELPQLINVLRGEMAVVGPRPEVPRYVDLYTPEQRRVLSVRPGLTDPASVTFRSESELLANHADPERAYIEEIMPRKLALNLEYIDHRRLGTDFCVMWATLKAVVRPGYRE